jgi:hypothetical protein
MVGLTRGWSPATVRACGAGDSRVPSWHASALTDFGRPRETPRRRPAATPSRRPCSSAGPEPAGDRPDNTRGRPGPGSRPADVWPCRTGSSASRTAQAEYGSGSPAGGVGERRARRGGLGLLRSPAGIERAQRSDGHHSPDVTGGCAGALRVKSEGAADRSEEREGTERGLRVHVANGGPHPDGVLPGAGGRPPTGSGRCCCDRGCRSPARRDRSAPTPVNRFRR